jgi:hypothetical protein
VLVTYLVALGLLRRRQPRLGRRLQRRLRPRDRHLRRLSLIGAIAATGIPARRAPSAEGVAQTQPIPALEVEG